MPLDIGVQGLRNDKEVLDRIMQGPKNDKEILAIGARLEEKVDLLVGGMTEMSLDHVPSILPSTPLFLGEMKRWESSSYREPLRTCGELPVRGSPHWPIIGYNLGHFRLETPPTM